MNSRDKIKILLKESDDYKKLIKAGVDEKILSNFSAFDSRLRDMPEKYADMIFQYAIQKSYGARCSALLFSETQSDAALEAFYHRTKQICSIGNLTNKWSEEKNYLIFTKELTSVLVDSMEDEDFDIATDDLNHLPYNTFFIDTIKDNEPTNNYVIDNMFGCLIDKQSPDKRHSCNYLIVTILFEENGEMNSFHVDIPLEKDITIGKICNKIKEDSLAAINHVFGNDSDKYEKYKETLSLMDMKESDLKSQFSDRALAVQEARIFIAKQIVPQLLYLSAKEPEIKYTGNTSCKPNSKNNNTSSTKGVNKCVVGSEFALKYCKFIDEYKRNSGSSKGGDEVVRTMPPHLRRAHYHRHWVGSDENPEKNGPRRLVRMWQEPTFVHAEYKEFIQPIVRVVDKNIKDCPEKNDTARSDDFENDLEYSDLEELDDR